MTARILVLLVSNGLMLLLGVGLLPLLRLARTRRDLLTRLPLAYAVGLVATGVLAAELAVVDVPVGRIGLPLLAGASLLLGLSRLEPAAVPTGPRPRLLPLLPSLAVLGVAVAFLVVAGRLFAVKPLFESDGWTIWGTRARALYEFGHPTGPVFTSSLYPALQHPNWLPALEALDFRFLGRFDGSLAVAQLFGLALALVGGGWTLLRRHASPVLLAGALLAILTAPSFFHQLPTNFADVPLGILMGLGLAALAAWLRAGEPGLLPAAVLFLGAAAITKNEGELFVLAAFAAQPPSRGAAAAPTRLCGADGARDRPALADLDSAPQRRISEYSLSSLFSPGYLESTASRAPRRPRASRPDARRAVEQARSPDPRRLRRRARPAAIRPRSSPRSGSRSPLEGSSRSTGSPPIRSEPSHQLVRPHDRRTDDRLRPARAGPDRPPANAAQPGDGSTRPREPRGR